MGENTFDRKAKVLALIGRLPDELRDTIEKKVDEQGQFLVDQIRPLVPVDMDDAERIHQELKDALDQASKNK